MDFSKFDIVEKEAKKAISKEDIVKEAKIAKNYEYLISIKRAGSFHFTTNVVIKVLEFKDRYCVAVVTCKLKNKDKMLKSVSKEYRKMGRIKIEDFTKDVSDEH